MYRPSDAMSYLTSKALLGGFIFDRAQTSEARLGIIKRLEIKSMRLQPVPSIFFYDPSCLVKWHWQSLIVTLHTTWMCRNKRRWRLVVVVLVDTKWRFTYPDPGVLNVGVWLLGEWEA